MLCVLIQGDKLIIPMSYEYALFVRLKCGDVVFIVTLEMIYLNVLAMMYFWSHCLWIFIKGLLILLLMCSAEADV